MPYQIENRKYAFTASHIHRLLPMPHIHSHLEIIYLIKGSSITDIAYVSGFSSVRTFNRAFLKHLDMTPRDYIKQKILNEEK